MIERSRLQYLPLVWPVRQSGAAVEHNDVILTLGLHTTCRVLHTSKSHVSLASYQDTLLENDLFLINIKPKTPQLQLSY